MKKELTPKAIIMKLILAGLVCIGILAYSLVPNDDGTNNGIPAIASTIFLVIIIYGIFDKWKEWKKN